MATALDESLPRPGWLGAEVPLDGIQEAWDEEWARTADVDPDTPAATRTLTSNLIVVGLRPHRILEALEIVAERHACRAFLVVWDNQTPGITAEVLSRLSDSADEAPDEVVMLRCGEDEFPRLVGLLRPLLVADIPVHLHWGLRIEGKLLQLRMLAEISERISVDSGSFPDPAVEFGLLETLFSDTPYSHQDRPLRHDPVDLSHYRLAPWRQGLAQAFEFVRYDRAQDTDVQLRHCDQAPPSGGCFTLARWMRKRLGASVSLEPCGPGAAPANARPGDPVGLILHHGPNTVHLKPEGDVLLTQVTTGDRCLLPFAVAMPRRPIGLLLADAVAGTL